MTAVASVLAADVPTPNGVSYVGRVCGHFAHKLTVERDGPVGAVLFDHGRCDLVADDAALHLRVTATDAAQAASVADVIGRHFERFATREGLSVNWTDATASHAL